MFSFGGGKGIKSAFSGRQAGRMEDAGQIAGQVFILYILND